MKKLVNIIMLSSWISFAQQTPLEKKDYAVLTSYGELTSFVNELDKSSDLLNVEILGKTVEGRNLYVLKFSNSEFGKDNSKIKVLIFAQQHGNEQSGKEGALLLARELLKPENKYLFDKIDFALVPQMNPDGSEKNRRRNGNDMDLNRNHLILTEPETVALHKLFDKYLFEVTMDVHEYSPYGDEWKKYGYRKNIDETVGALTNINISQEIRELSYDNYLPFIFDYFSINGFSVFHYLPGGPPDIDYIRYSTFDINDGRQSFGIQNTLSFIQEGLNGEDYNTDRIERRARGQMTGMFGLLEFSYRQKDEIKKIIAQERERLILNDVSDEVAVQLDHVSDGNKLVLPLLSYYSNSDTLVTVNDYRPIVKSTHDVERPSGYLIPKKLTEVVEWADRHSLTYFDYTKSEDDKIEQYFISGIDSIDFERDIIVNPIVEVKEISNNLSGNDYIFIPTNQLRNNMIVIALEPKSMLGIVTYKKFEKLLKESENFPILRVISKN
jgi:hypothetical protein